MFTSDTFKRVYIFSMHLMIVLLVGVILVAMWGRLGKEGLQGWFYTLSYSGSGNWIYVFVCIAIVVTWGSIFLVNYFHKCQSKDCLILIIGLALTDIGLAGIIWENDFGFFLTYDVLTLAGMCTMLIGLRKSAVDSFVGAISTAVLAFFIYMVIYKLRLFEPPGIFLIAPIYLSLVSSGILLFISLRGFHRNHLQKRI